MGTVADSAPQPSQAGSGRNGGGQFAGVRITSNADNNTVLIYARRDQQAMIEQTIMALDKPSAQVAIEATIAEVVLTNDLRYGVQYYLKGKDGGASLIRDATRTALKQVLPGFNIILGPESDPRVVLDALRGVTEVKVLSSPSVVVVDNRPASLQVGDEVPIVTRTSQSTDNPDAPIVNNVEFRNTGVILNVLPRITGDGTINLEIQQEISSVIGSDTGSLTPTISQRRVSSTVSVMSGQTVLLGGMISEKQTQGREGIPVLGDIPLLGDAFRKTTNAASRTELIVLIRAQVIRDSLDAQHVAEEMRSQLRIMNDGTPRVPLPKPSPSILR
jgi:general secretion pathway protein D